MWCDEGAIANILFFQQVADKYLVEYWMGLDVGQFVVTTKMGELTFLPHPKGLYYLDMTNLKRLHTRKESKTTEAIFMMETVHCNFKGYT